MSTKTIGLVHGHMDQATTHDLTTTTTATTTTATTVTTTTETLMDNADPPVAAGTVVNATTIATNAITKGQLNVVSATSSATRQNSATSNRTLAMMSVPQAL